MRDHRARTTSVTIRSVMSDTCEPNTAFDQGGLAVAVDRGVRQRATQTRLRIDDGHDAEQLFADRRRTRVLVAAGQLAFDEGPRLRERVSTGSLHQPRTCSPAAADPAASPARDSTSVRNRSTTRR